MKIENLQEFEWIRNNVKPIDNKKSELWRGNTVGNLLPEKFDKYLKILHPMYKDKFVQDKKLSWDEVGNVEGVSGERILWRHLDDLKLAMNYKTIKNYSDTEKYSPTYIWSDDKEICINTDYDLQFTLVGCSSRLLKEIIKNEYLECIEVEYTTRIDYKAME